MNGCTYSIGRMRLLLISLNLPPVASAVKEVAGLLTRR